jgi:hypothetical protein
VLTRCFFDEVRCSQGIKRLDNYRQEWDSKLGVFRSQPLHDDNSNGADAFRTFAVGFEFIQRQDNILHNPRYNDTIGEISYNDHYF